MNWTQFFRNAGIPDAAAQQYCTSFVKNRIQQSDLPELDKETLVQLGVKAIGDQLAILRQAKKGGSQSASVHSTTIVAKKTQRVKIEAPDSSSSTHVSDSSLASFHRKGRPPPDSHEIYHVKMPQGTTAKSRQILMKAQHIHRSGAVARGTTGVRQGGRAVSPIDKSSVAVQSMRREQGPVRVINQHLSGRQNPRVTYATRTVTVTVPERQPRQRISFGSGRETRTVSRTVVNRPIGKVVSNSRVTKRVERVGTSRPAVQNRITYTGGRNSRIEVVNDFEEDDNEELYYEDDGDSAEFMEDDDGYVEYDDQPRGNVFNRITM